MMLPAAKRLWRALKFKMKSKILAGMLMNGKWDLVPSKLTEVAR